MSPSHKIPVGISACLCGDEVRFDGSHTRDRYLMEVLGPYVRWVKTCPEEGAGLGTPRESLRLVRTPNGVRMVGNRSTTDVTERIDGYSDARLEELRGERLRGYVLKKSSPSCGMERVRIYDDKGVPSRDGVGLFARALIARYPNLPVEEEGRLRDPRLRENFVTRIFAYDRWINLRGGDPRPRDIVAFHTQHKMLVLAHSPEHYARMGPLVAQAGSLPMPELLDRYEDELMGALARIASPGRHANTLEHLAGYLKRDLEVDDKRELHDAIRAFREGQLPLVAPLMLLYHHFRHLRDDWVDAQVYLQPYPAELALRSSI